MNHLFCVIWNERLGTYVPVPESTHLRGKRCSAHVITSLVLCAVSFAAHALPTGGQVSAGQGSIAHSGSAMTVNQQSQNLSINWSSFGIGPSESVSFAQPNASAIALNRVLGADPTQIYGRLSANGQVWILNPNGVLFGGGAQVNVGGLLASTLNISDADFLAGRRTFSGAGGAVTNQGSISAADGGYVALLGGKVSNEGVIQARLGTAALGAGNKVTLDFAGDKLLNLQVDEGAVNALALNKQLIRADGGSVLLSARAADALLGTVVNNTGVIEARTIENKNGTIKLLGDAGAVNVAGTLDASAPSGGDGGTIETSGRAVKVADSARITTAAPAGNTGRWVIDPANFIIAPGRGSDMTGAALGNELNTTEVTILSSSGHSGGTGDIMVNDNVSWNSPNNLTLSAYHDVQLARNITNAGTGGVTLRADNTGSCVAGASNCGTVRFTPQARIGVNGGAVNLYYNPVGSNNVADANGNGPSYATPTDYSRYVNLNGGSTLTSWMLVNDVNQLQAMNTNLAGNYALGRDIDATATAGWNAGAGFVPVGAAPEKFMGNLDGLTHVVSGLTIHRPSSEDIGLLGRNGGSVRNVGLEAGDVSGLLNTGMLVGHNFGTVASSYSSGNAGALHVNSVGGLVGSNDGGTVSDSYSTARVIGDDNLGGLVGNNTGTIRGSYSTGTVETAFGGGTGGLVGYNGATGLVSDSYSAGRVLGGFGAAGGLVGVNNGTVNNSYSTGDTDASRSDVGGLVGANGGTVSNSHSTGATIGLRKVGGLIGTNDGAVSSSYATGAVYGTFSAGGLIGSNEGGTVQKSHSSGNVTGSIDVGGLVGFNQSSTVSDSYSTGAVTGDEYVGGLVGGNYFATVNRSYSTGPVKGTLYTGGLVGFGFYGTHPPASPVSNSYWDITTSGQSTSAGGTGLTDAQMKQQSSFVGFDFLNVWDINEGVSYPFLRGQ